MLQAAGLLFFAFAGYARIATLGEEVRDPARTIPRAIPIALGITLVVYAAVAVAVLAVLGPDRLAATPHRSPTRSHAAGAARRWPRWSGSARRWPRSARCWRCSSGCPAPPGDGPRPAPAGRAGRGAPALPGARTAPSSPSASWSPWWSLVADVRGAIGFSSFAVLVYYAIAKRQRGRWDAGPCRRLGWQAACCWPSRCR